MPRTTTTIVLTLIVASIILAAGAIGFVFSGIYPIAADRPHVGVVRWLLSTVQRRSVAFHAEETEAPPLDDPELVRLGLVLYEEHCLVCHGAPGVPRQQIGRGINPTPPPLYMAAPEWSDAQVYWIIKHGLKMAGMPSFNASFTERELWAMTAFTRRLPELSVAEYRAMVAAVQPGAPAADIAWVARDDPGFAMMASQGDRARGRRLLEAYGCGACHVIPGVIGADGTVGAPLVVWGERHFIAGTLLNTPRNLVAWIVDPQAIEPGTAMPDLDVTPAEALDMAAYLFTLGGRPSAVENRRQRQASARGAIPPD